MILIEIALYLQNSLPLLNRCLLLIAIVLQLFSFDILVRVEKVYFSSEYIFVNFITYPPSLPGLPFPRAFLNKLINILCLDVWNVKWDAWLRGFFQTSCWEALFFLNRRKLPLDGILVLALWILICYSLPLRIRFSKFIKVFEKVLFSLDIFFLLIKRNSFLMVFFCFFLTSS